MASISAARRLPALADLDGDGDLDLVVGSKVDPAAGDSGRLTIFTNTGTRPRRAFRQAEPLKLADVYHLAPAFGDLDGDGDADLLVGTWNQDVLFFRNSGAAGPGAGWPTKPRTIRPPRASHSTPALGDVDGDRDLDLFIGQANGSVLFYRNTGTPKAPRFELATGMFEELRAGRRSVPTLADIDRDGRLDLVVGREAGAVSVYRNTGTGATVTFSEMKDVVIALPPAAAPAIADLTGDGVPDLIAGTVSGGLQFFRGK